MLYKSVQSYIKHYIAIQSNRRQYKVVENIQRYTNQCRGKQTKYKDYANQYKGMQTI